MVSHTMLNYLVNLQVMSCNSIYYYPHYHPMVYRLVKLFKDFLIESFMFAANLKIKGTKEAKEKRVNNLLE